MRAACLALTASVLPLSGCAAPGGPPHADAANIDLRWIDTVIAADKADEEFPGYVAARPATTLAQAYVVQQRLIAAEYGTDNAIAGFKGGFASPEALARFGIDRPVLGVLPAKGRVAAPYDLALGDFRKLVIECEFGFQLAHDITRPIADDAEMKRLIGAVGPAIELPDVGLVAGEHSVVDHVAANISAARFIFVPQASPDALGMDLNAQVASLALDGKELQSGSARKVYGDQWKALRSVLNTALEVGYRPKAGDVVLTGAMVQMEARRGHYVARFGALGNIEFEVR